MTTIDLRLAYKRNTGETPFMTNGDYLVESLRNPYFKWLEELVLKYVKEDDIKNG